MTEPKKTAKTPTTKAAPEPEIVKEAVEVAPEPVAVEPAPTPTPRTVLLGGAAERGIPDGDLYVSEDIELPDEITLLTPEQFGPTSLFVRPATFSDEGVALDYTILEERLKGLTFDSVVGRSLQKKKRLKVIKAMKQDGTLIQLPWERRINNASVGRDNDQIGMLVYTDKGYLLLQDDQKYPYYCFAIDCWAAAMRTSLKGKFPEQEEAIGSGYCSIMHADHTNPNKSAGIFGEAATTSQTWNV